MTAAPEPPPEAPALPPPGPAAPPAPGRPPREGPAAASPCPAMVRFSAAIDHWAGVTPAVPRPPDWLAWPARNPSTVASPELDAWTDPKVKKRAITGQLNAARARTSRPP